MSTGLAIASVTAVLKDLLNNGLIDHDITGAIGGNVNVTALPPDRIDTTSANPQSQLNVFMYQVTTNQGWRNIALPSRNKTGERVSNPPLALDLHYLLTAYGVNELHAEILLGYGMQLFHETPVLAREAIRNALAPPSSVSGGGLPAELQALSTSELAEQVEQIKITPDNLNAEEISKLWSAFQAKYRPSMAYQTSVVLIESKRPTKTSLPVRKRIIYATPFRWPVVEKIDSQENDSAEIIADQPILSGYNLVIRGRQLESKNVLVKIGGIEVIPSTDTISDKRIIVQLPAGLVSGVQGVQVVHQTMMGDPPVLHNGVESNIEPFVLRPGIETVNASDLQTTGGDIYSGNIDVTINPAVSDTQRAVLLLNELGPSDSPAAYSFSAPPMALLDPPAPTVNLSIAFSGVKAGTFLARIMVDGAESPLTIDADGQYNAPQVTIP